MRYAVRFLKAKIFAGQSVYSLLRRRSIPIVTLSKSINHETSLSLFREYQPDLFVSVQGNEIFRQPLLDIAPCINLHTALLPRYRGLMPTFWVLANRESHTGVSVFFC